MRRAILGIAFLSGLLTALGTTSLLAGDSNDHLIAIDLARFPKYRKVQLALLGQSRFDFGRTIIHPAFTPESSISVYSRSQETRIRYFVTCCTADRNIWQTTDIGRLAKEARHVKTRTVTAELPPETARLIKDAWAKMLRHVRGPAHPPQDQWEVIPQDGTDIEFWLDEGHGSIRRGKVNQFLSRQRPKVRMLLSISQDLLEYTKASPAKQQKMSAGIEAKAKRLLAAP